MKGPREKRRLAVSTMLDATTPPEVLRAHAIRDTIGAIRNHTGNFALQCDERDAIALELGVPALWVAVAMGRETVTLENLQEWRQWYERTIRPFVERGKERA
jgi:hypothetical protein